MDDLRDPTCADCKAFYMEAKDITGTVRGLCRFRGELGEVPATMPYCHLFRVREAQVGLVKEVVVKQAASGRGGARRSPARIVEDEGPPRATLAEPVMGDTDGEIAMDRDGLKQVLRELLEEETLYGYPRMGERWQDGTLVMKPGAEETQAKEVSLESFFHKIVMVRDRLRVLEAKINGHSKLEEKDKVELQGYLTKCYGSLTTFNVLFQDKSDHFNSKS
jgi:hypothetical protein